MKRARKGGVTFWHAYYRLASFVLVGLVFFVAAVFLFILPQDTNAHGSFCAVRTPPNDCLELYSFANDCFDIFTIHEHNAAAGTLCKGNGNKGYYNQCSIDGDVENELWAHQCNGSGTCINSLTGVFEIHDTCGACGCEENGLPPPSKNASCVPIPATLGNACTSAANNCGTRNSGTIQCNGTCSASTPPNESIGGACTSAPNNCGTRNSGTIQCGGSCSASTPANESIGGACTSAPNNCGSTNSGTTQCGGSCSASTPANESIGGACNRNACGGTGVILCGGGCSAPAPPCGGPSAPSISSPTATSITTTSAVLGAAITSDGGAAVTSRGTYWGTSPNPTTNWLLQGSGVGTFSHTRTGLPAGTLIYFRACASNSVGTACASSNFTTLASAETLFVAFDPAGVSGTEPYDPGLEALVSGTATGTINYSFWWNCTDTTTDVGAAFISCGSPFIATIGAKFDGTSVNPQSAPHTYSSGTYTAKVIVERGAAPSAQDQVLITVSALGGNTPPSASNLNVSVTTEPNAPCITHADFSWSFSDLEDGVTQSGYQLQADQNFINPPVFDSGEVLSAAQSLSVNVLASGGIPFNESYKWRVRVRDSSGLWSGWFWYEDPFGVQTTFATPTHAAPTPSFSTNPAEVQAGAPIEFTNTSTAYGGASITPADSVWTFQNATPSSANGSPTTTTFSGSGSKQVTLEAYDSDGFSCTLNSSITIDLTLPGFEEVPPTGALSVPFARLFATFDLFGWLR